MGCLLWVFEYITVSSSPISSISERCVWGNHNDFDESFSNHITWIESHVMNGVLIKQQELLCTYLWLMQKRRYSSALAMELHLSCFNPSICFWLSTRFLSPLKLQGAGLLHKTLRPRQNGCQFPDDILKWMKIYEFWLKFHLGSN